MLACISSLHLVKLSVTIVTLLVTALKRPAYAEGGAGLKERFKWVKWERRGVRLCRPRVEIELLSRDRVLRVLRDGQREREVMVGQVREQNERWREVRDGGRRGKETEALFPLRLKSLIPSPNPHAGYSSIPVLSRLSLVTFSCGRIVRIARPRRLADASRSDTVGGRSTKDAPEER